MLHLVAVDFIIMTIKFSGQLAINVLRAFRTHAVDIRCLDSFYSLNVSTDFADERAFPSAWWPADIQASAGFRFDTLLDESM